MSEVRSEDLAIARAALKRAGIEFMWDDVDALEDAAMNAEPGEGGKYIRLRNRIAALLPSRDDEA